MARALHVVPPPPSLHTALERSRFAARTRKSYAQDLAPLLARVAEQPVTSLTHLTTAMFLATQAHLADSAWQHACSAWPSLESQFDPGSIHLYTSVHSVYQGVRQFPA